MKFLSTIILIFVNYVVFAQNTVLLGTVEGNTDVENSHITNTTQKIYATTNKQGVFTIEAKLGDTLKISAVQYATRKVLVEQQHIASKKIVITMQLAVNALDEVVVKPHKLTGNLTDDIMTSKAKRPINFYDVGIPGYTGKPLTQSERRLKDADEGVIFYGTGINLHKLLNKISGRTKMLKNRVKIETNLAMLKRIKYRLFTAFFKQNPLKEDQIMDFFYFCLEDTAFENRCKNKSDLEIMAYLEERYKKYQSNLKQ